MPYCEEICTLSGNLTANHTRIQRTEQSWWYSFFSLDDDIHMVCGQAGAAPPWGPFPWPLVGPGPP